MRPGRPRKPWWLIVSIAGVSAIGYLTHAFPPDAPLAVIGFFLTLLFSSYLFFLFLLNHPRRAGLASIGISLILLLRMAGLRELWYVILLVAALFSLELTSKTR